MAGFSDYLEDKIINVFLRNTAYSPVSTVYFAAHTADPLDTGLGNTGTTRVAITLTAPSGGSSSNTATVTLTGVTGGTYAYGSLWDASTSGNMFYSGALTASKTVDTGDNLIFNAGEIVVTNT